MTLTYPDIVATVSGALLLVIGLIWYFVRPVSRFTFSRRRCPLAIRDEENQLFFTSSNRLSSISTFETIGNLTISQDRRPLPSALDIINHVGMAIGLPASAKPVRLKDVPRVSLHLPPVTPMTPTTKVNIVMMEAEAKAGSLHTSSDAMLNTATSGRAYFVHLGTAPQARNIENQADVTSRRGEPTIAMKNHNFDLGLETCLDEPLGEIQDVFVIGHDDDNEPEQVNLADYKMAYGFGSGRSMAALYHAV
jgi:hypothetical protein